MNCINCGKVVDHKSKTWFWCIACTIDAQKHFGHVKMLLKEKVAFVHHHVKMNGGLHWKLTNKVDILEGQPLFLSMKKIVEKELDKHYEMQLFKAK